MRLRTTTISILAIGLLAGSAVGVAAQDEEADPLAPASVTGSISGNSDTSGSVTRDAGVTITEGVGFRQTWVASDPRLSGSVVYTGNWHGYDGTGGMSVQATSVVLVNDDGRWSGAGTALSAGDFDMDTMILRGEGAYEGLTAYVMQDWGGRRPSRLHGSDLPGRHAGVAGAPHRIAPPCRPRLSAPWRRRPDITRYSWRFSCCREDPSRWTSSPEREYQPRSFRRVLATSRCRPRSGG
jgi:hypothetical protein